MFLPFPLIYLVLKFIFTYLLGCSDAGSKCRHLDSAHDMSEWLHSPIRTYAITYVEMYSRKTYTRWATTRHKVTPVTSVTPRAVDRCCMLIAWDPQLLLYFITLMSCFFLLTLPIRRLPTLSQTPFSVFRVTVLVLRYT